MVIVAMNLLIAIISDEYAEAQENEDKYLYIEKTDMILEAAIHVNHNMITGLSRMCSSKKKDEGADVIGMITILSPKAGGVSNDPVIVQANKIKQHIE